MTTDTHIRNLILKKISQIPNDKLNELDAYVTKLGASSNKISTLSYAGSWQDLDDAIFKELTDNLISNRQRNGRKNNE